MISCKELPLGRVTAATDVQQLDLVQQCIWLEAPLCTSFTHHADMPESKIRRFTFGSRIPKADKRLHALMKAEHHPTLELALQVARDGSWLQIRDHGPTGTKHLTALQV